MDISEQSCVSTKSEETTHYSGLSKSKTEGNVSYSNLSKTTASIVAKVLANNKDVANAHVNGQSLSLEEEKLPCEFCEAMIPMYKLHTHQAECVNTTGTVRARYSGLDRGLDRASSLRETGHNQTLANYGLDRSNTSSRVNKYLRQSSTETPTQSETPPSVNGNSPHRKISPTNSSIVNRYLPSPDHKKSSYLAESP